MYVRKKSMPKHKKMFVKTVSVLYYQELFLQVVSKRMCVNWLHLPSKEQHIQISYLYILNFQVNNYLKTKMPFLKYIYKNKLATVFSHLKERQMLLFCNLQQPGTECERLRLVWFSVTPRASRCSERICVKTVL